MNVGQVTSTSQFTGSNISYRPFHDFALSPAGWSRQVGQVDRDMDSPPVNQSLCPKLDY